MTPGTGFMSLLLMGGGCRMGLGALVRHTGRPAAHIRIPVIPGIDTHAYNKEKSHVGLLLRSKNVRMDVSKNGCES